MEPDVRVKPTRSPAARARRRREALVAFACLAPSALILGAFGFLPILNALVLSFHQWRLVPEGFVGLANYRMALLGEGEAEQFRQSLLVTLYYAAGTVPVTVVLGYLAAEFLHSRIRGLSFYRTLYFLPYVVSPVAAAAVWKWILNPNFGIATAAANRFGLELRWLHEERGVVTLLGEALALHVPAWASGPSLALTCIIAAGVWHSVGFAVVVLLAGLAAIPRDVTEAAQLDGARGWSLVRQVKLPLLSPTLFFLLIVFSIRAFQTFTQIYVLSVDNAGGPAGTTRNLTLYIVQSFHDNAPRLGPGYGSAVAILLFLMILVLTLLQFRLLGRRVHYG
jgi:ABC-type sugar transport system permease subunit